MTLFDDVFAGPQGVAASLLNQFGTAATLRRETKVYSAATGKNTVTDSDESVLIKPPEPFDQSRINDTTIQEGDLTTMIAADGLSITPNTRTDKIVYLDTVWQIVRVSPIVSGDVTAAYEIQIRQ